MSRTGGVQQKSNASASLNMYQRYSLTHNPFSEAMNSSSGESAGCVSATVGDPDRAGDGDEDGDDETAAGDEGGESGADEAATGDSGDSEGDEDDDTCDDEGNSNTMDESRALNSAENPSEERIGDGAGRELGPAGRHKK